MCMYVNVNNKAYKGVCSVADMQALQLKMHLMHRLESSTQIQLKF